MSAFQAHATGCPNSISQYAALGAIQNGSEDRTRMVEQFERRKNIFGQRLAAIPSISYPEPGGAFYYLVDVSKYYKPCGVSGSSEFCEKLLEEKGLLVVPGDAFGCDDTIRFSFAAGEEDLSKALDRFEAFIKCYSK
jgi:aspartate aminotransferase